MTKRECAIVSAYTGVVCGGMEYFIEYLSELEGRDIVTIEIPKVTQKHSKRIREDFINLKVSD